MQSKDTGTSVTAQRETALLGSLRGSSALGGSLQPQGVLNELCLQYRGDWGVRSSQQMTNMRQTEIFWGNMPNGPCSSHQLGSRAPRRASISGHAEVGRSLQVNAQPDAVSSQQRSYWDLLPAQSMAPSVSGYE